MDALVDFTSLLKTYPRNNKLKFDNRINHWLPLVPSQKLAGLVADLMADGHLQGDPKWRFDYCSNSRCELNRFEKTIAELFGLKGKIRDCTTNQYNTKNYGVNYRPLAKSLFLIGVPCGNKVMKKYSIPTWILNDKKLFASFVRRYFDCEAGIDVAGKSIAVELHKSVDLTDSGTFFLNQMRRGLLNYFGIKSTVPFLLSRKNKRKCGAVV
ncbi:hypothetical protein KJ891_05435 [Candidatus Micrarchaeota archaeon]|nr:hypothetical protein [Candidatus Micrarchaeota archaeon]